MNSYRTNLDAVHKMLQIQPGLMRNDQETNTGLWLDKYITEQKSEDTKGRRGLIEEVSTLSVPIVYKAYYDRWEKALMNCGAQTRKATVMGRMIIGLGNESVLETSISLHRTYGVPYIPGSALKGLAASYADQQLGEDWKKDSTAYKVVFGDMNSAGYVTFFDALYIPGKEDKERALHPDVITVHHQKYYQGENEAPTDKDSPIPVPFLSATGTYLIALAAPDLKPGDEWIKATFKILEEALAKLGIGAKTSSGYGRMKFLPPPTVPADPDMKKAEGYIREVESIRDVASQIHGYYQKWQQLTSKAARMLLAQAIIEKVRQAGREKASKEKSWYKELLLFLDEK